MRLKLDHQNPAWLYGQIPSSGGEGVKKIAPAELSAVNMVGDVLEVILYL